LADLGSPASLSGLWWQEDLGAAQAAFYLDAITLVATSGTPAPTAVPGAGPALSVNTGLSRHTISPLIYGMNYAPAALLTELDLPVNRWGGNSTTRYNWQNDTYNTASDWYFQNIPNPDPGTLPNGSAADQFIDDNRAAGAESIITVPLIGWVAKRRPPNGTHPYDCGFSVAKYGAQQSTDAQWDPDCGNGRYPNGSAITGNDPADTSLAVGPSFVAGWVNHLQARYGAAAAGGVRLYALDNEPMLWNSTHRDVHPQAVTYTELRDRTYQYAAALKAADPTAQTLGPVLWGWCAYLYSAADGCGPGADYAAHGNTPFVAWYLAQMQAYQQANGVRLVDYLDLHYYPQADGVSLSSAGGAATQALRLRSTRGLWDPAYIDESWISDTEPGGVAVRLIPRMREWVNAQYPGTRLAITEYNWGGLESLNGALAQADVLGIFGREGLDLATLWAPPEPAQPGAFAFRIFRNYDGLGGRFGDIGVSAQSQDQGALAVYAAQRASDNALTVLVINKTGGALTSTLSLAGFTPAPAAAVYRYSAGNLNAIVRQADQAVSAAGFTAVYPANSLTLVVLPPGVPLDKRVYLPQVRR
ncbi:MAG: glycoside hydrolase family 44 protein, partial [Anaerolineales bacterium]|nr:glycoside hydrolase family 44 protein [Anaerolineales bacterium]